MQGELQNRVHLLLPEHHPRPEIQLLYDMMRDYPARGGKGIRAQLLMASAQAHGARPETAAWDHALWLATVVELFQNWVLIHDDIEDNSEERRGRPAMHRVHGVPLAINAGDALHAYMWAAVARAGVPDAFEEVLEMIHRTAEGQHVDLAWVEHGTWDLTPQDYLEMVRLKTAYYTVVIPLRLGALAAGAVPDEAFGAAGVNLGAAFQIRDDVLNLIADAGVYGKEIGGDLLEGKRTLIVLDWLTHASPEQRAFFLTYMALPRPEKPQADTAQILHWILGSGSVERAQAVADEHARRGLDLLRGALRGAPDQDAAAQILRQMERLATRDA